MTITTRHPESLFRPDLHTDRVHLRPPNKTTPHPLPIDIVFDSRQSGIHIRLALLVCHAFRSCGSADLELQIPPYIPYETAFIFTAACASSDL
ncbi:unnamed protein product [Zymoseptoria tritici ST99CH_3D7]|uniref:Uncharacterized protein n=1 Tax=Zymoseptoria tritici (strain ST99CH_3D7) TaxID=1276538 RepID=A0A1X7RE68_ZYMT9|nr:unnamed protein product [Zymoseptoria tritici ST99CH_3D7]